jgi:hypothetical protein
MSAMIGLAPKLSLVEANPAFADRDQHSFELRPSLELGDNVPEVRPQRVQRDTKLIRCLSRGQAGRYSREYLELTLRESGRATRSRGSSYWRIKEQLNQDRRLKQHLAGADSLDRRDQRVRGYVRIDTPGGTGANAGEDGIVVRGGAKNNQPHVRALRMKACRQRDTVYQHNRGACGKDSSRMGRIGPDGHHIKLGIETEDDGKGTGQQCSIIDEQYAHTRDRL